MSGYMLFFFLWTYRATNERIYPGFARKQTPMATYDPKQVFADYASGQITPEMAVGHSLQHIELLYAAIKANQQEGRAKTDTLEKRVNLHQSALERLTAWMEKMRAKTKKSNAIGQPKADQL